ncbi:regulator of hemoglobinization and erythroid cell expansion protein isoform X1 [Apteryx rowi]|uniref:regulator of hemoglobinization and erythroid cell expansion protein isoform X1 n=2 Tax=Apteryx rowi TaxID=308060 RepID=UPI000E1C6874|nr:regulator of hemoglobinization and erythroid cell expansion protein isoform X1 [Apteryx rowi]
MDCAPWWVLVAISAATLMVHALFLAALYIMLSRKIEHLRGSGEAGGGGTAVKPERPLMPVPVPAPAEEAVPRAAYAEGSDTSSETSDDSGSSLSDQQLPGPEERLNYTSLCFAGKGHGPAAAADYENMKTGTDYVNVDPKKKKADFWTCSSPVAAKSIEYTEVKL